MSNFNGRAVTVTVPADERFVHPVLWGAPGVADAARAVVEAVHAGPALQSERTATHAKWRRELAAGVLTADFERAPEPPRGLSGQEERDFAAARRGAELHLEAVVAANAETVVEGLRDWEVDAVAEVREHVAALERLAGQFTAAGKALTALANAEHRKPDAQSRPSVEDLLYVARKPEDDVAVLDFGDGRTLWLKVSGVRR